MAWLTFQPHERRRTPRTPLAAAIAIGMVLAGSSAGAQNSFLQKNLVSDIPGLAHTLDAQLQNPWGISMSATSPFWVANNGSGTSTLYNSLGNKLGLVVTIPNGVPTGTVFNSTGTFGIASGGNALFLFANEAGQISGWNGGAGTNAQVVINQPGAEYTGLAIAGSGSSARLYGANFAAGVIDVFDGSYSQVFGGFVDPGLPAGYAPFNVQAIGGLLYVAYALKDPGTGEETTGAGLGLVSVFDPNGAFVRRLVSNGALNAPWGFALAPAGFGTFANALLVGNFGDGTINAFDASTGTHLGVMQNGNGSPIVNEGLWGITFGNGGNGGTPDVLYFAAGIEDEEHGLFGSLSLTPEPATLGLMATGLALVFAGALRRRPRAQTREG